MSQYHIGLDEFQIQLNALYFYSQNLATLIITPKLRNWHQYNSENWTTDLTPFSAFLHACLCIQTHSLLWLFFSKARTKRLFFFFFAMQSSPQPHLVTAWCALGPVGGSPKSLFGLPGSTQQNWWKPIGSDFALV